MNPHPDFPALLAKAEDQEWLAAADDQDLYRMVGDLANALRTTHEARVRAETILTSAGGIDPTELDDAADIVEAENGYLARQLRGAASAARAALSVPQGEK